jgi:hypothetical protein
VRKDVTVLLKNGTVLVGRILSESTNFLSIEVNSTSLNILKGLIAEVNGIPFAPTGGRQEGREEREQSVSPTDTSVAVPDSLPSGHKSETAPADAAESASVMRRGGIEQKIQHQERLIPPSAAAVSEDTARIIDSLHILLNNPNLYVRRKEVNALASLLHPAAVEPLIDALEDTDPSVRKRAAEGLGAILDPRAIPSLVSLVNFEQQPSVKKAASEAVKKLTEIELLIDELRNGNRHVRENAQYVLWLMTVKEFKDDVEAWEQWWKEQQHTAKTPSAN